MTDTGALDAALAEIIRRHGLQNVVNALSRMSANGRTRTGGLAHHARLAQIEGLMDRGCTNTEIALVCDLSSGYVSALRTEVLRRRRQDARAVE